MTDPARGPTTEELRARAPAAVTRSAVYLAGPISLGGTCSDAETAEFVAAFARHARRLHDAGRAVLNPCELAPRPSWADYMRATIPMVCAADEVLALPRWPESRGARLEVFLARELGIPVTEAGPF